MKILSIRQPWAYLIVRGYKDIENRSWATTYRGPLLIHAGKTWDFPKSEAHAEFKAWSLDFPGDDAFHLGGIVGIASVVGCVNRSRSRWFTGPHGLVLRDARPLPFTPLRGKLGLFDAPAELLEELGL